MIVLAGNETRQNDLAMAMVGPVPDGAKKYSFIFWSDGEIDGCLSPNSARCPSISISSFGDVVVDIQAMSLAEAKEHAAEVMASYLED